MYAHEEAVLATRSLLTFGIIRQYMDVASK